MVQSPESLILYFFSGLIINQYKSSVSVCLEIQDIFSSKYIEANDSELPGMDLPQVQ